MSRSKNMPYYVNTVTKDSQWEKPEEEARGTEDTVAALHILVKHEGSRRPASWREATITRTKEEAQAKLVGLRQEIVDAGRTFSEIASKESDCSSAKNGGDLGRFGRGQMQAAFEEAAFGLKVGEMSGVVDTDSGLHIIIRTK